MKERILKILKVSVLPLLSGTIGVLIISNNKKKKEIELRDEMIFVSNVSGYLKDIKISKYERELTDHKVTLNKLHADIYDLKNNKKSNRKVK